MSREQGSNPETPDAAAGGSENRVGTRRFYVATDPGSGSFAGRGVRSPMVGRNAEVAIMEQCLRRVVEDQKPQLVTIVGNQGTGKSRLVSDFIASAVAPPIRVFHGRAEQDGPRNGIISSLLRDRFELREGDDSDAAIEHFMGAVQAVFDDERIAEVLHFLGDFLDFHFPDSPFLRVLNENRAQHDDIAHTVLRRFIEVDAQKSPLVLILDDLQWASDEIVGHLQEFGASLSGAPVMVVACTRPEMLVRCPDWGTGAAAHERIDVRNLDPEDAETMFRHLLSRCETVPDEVVDDAVEMTGGNPYFLEQLVRLFLVNGTVDTSQEVWRLDPDQAAETELPISVEEAIEARIAALETEERELLEKGAVFGNVFWLSAVVALARIETHRPTRAEMPGAPMPKELEFTWTNSDDSVRQRMEAMVAELCERDYLLQLDPEDSTIPGDIEVVFKHNLERELIVNSTESNRLARYHRLAAQWLETKLAGRSEEQLEFLAQLYERGGDFRRAAHCCLAGGDKARARYANQEAVNLYTRGLAMLDQDDALARLVALHNVGDVLDRVGNTKEALARFRDMLRLSWLFDNPSKAGAAHGRLGRIHRRLGEYDQAMSHLSQANQLFARAGDDRGLSATLDDIGKVHWLRGGYQHALDYYHQALEFRRTLGDQRSIALSLANIGRVHRDSGSFKAAIAHFRESLDLRRHIGDMSGVVQSLCDLGGVHADDGNHETALELFNEAHGIALEIGDKLAQTDVLSRLGECKSALGRGEEAVQHLRAAIGLATQLGNRVALSECCRRLAEVDLRIGDIKQAYEEAKRALVISESVGSRVHTANAHRVIAEVFSARGFAPEEQQQAEFHFMQAVDILGGMHNELELARVYRAFAVFCERIGMADRAAELHRQADEIFNRLRGAAAME